jgi:hypothetical protein
MGLIRSIPQKRFIGSSSSIHARRVRQICR